MTNASKDKGLLVEHGIILITQENNPNFESGFPDNREICIARTHFFEIRL